MAVSEVRTQLYLAKTQHEALKTLAAKRSVSMAQVVREAIAAYLAGAKKGALDEAGYLADPIWALPEVGESFGETGLVNAAERHDDYLYGPEKT